MSKKKDKNNKFLKGIIERICLESRSDLQKELADKIRENLEKRKSELSETQQNDFPTLTYCVLNFYPMRGNRIMSECFFSLDYRVVQTESRTQITTDIDMDERDENAVVKKICDAISVSLAKRTINRIQKIPIVYSANFMNDPDFAKHFQKTIFPVKVSRKITKHPAFSQYVNDVEPELCEKISRLVEENLSEYLRNKAGKYKDDDDFVQGKFDSCFVTLECFGSMQIGVCLSVNISYLDLCHFETKLESGSLFSDYQRGRESCQSAIIKTAIELAEKGMTKIRRFCFDGQTKDKEILSVLKNYLLKIEDGWYGVRGKCEMKFCAFLDNLKTDDLGVFYSNPQTFTIRKLNDRSEIYRFSKDDIKSGEKFSVQKIMRGPENFFEFYAFCQQVGELYHAYMEHCRKPDIIFTFSSKGIKKYETTNKEITQTAWSMEPNKNTTLESYLCNIFEQIKAYYGKTESLIAEQATILNTLNPSEFAILKHIFKEQRSWFTNINKTVGGRLPTTNVATGRYLEHLCELKIEGRNGEKSGLIFSQLRKGDYGDFYLYTPNPDLQRKSFEIASPRPYQKEELEDMSSDGKLRILSEMAQKAKDKDSRWEVVACLEIIPKAVAVRFAKSEIGKKFFQSLTDEDAIYARFFLEGLAGCKKLSKEYFEKKENDL